MDDSRNRLNLLEEADKAIDEEIKALPGYREPVSDTLNECQRYVHISIENLLSKPVSEYLALSLCKPERQRTLVAVADNEDEAMELLHALVVLENSKKTLEEELNRVQTVSYQFEESRKADRNRIFAKITELDEWLDNYRTTGRLAGTEQDGEIETPEALENNSADSQATQSIYQQRNADFELWIATKQSLDGMKKADIHAELMRRNTKKIGTSHNLWGSGFYDWWKEQTIYKGKPGRKPG